MKEGDEDLAAENAKDAKVCAGCASRTVLDSFRREDCKAFFVCSSAQSAIKTNQSHARCLSAAPLQCRSQLKRVRSSQQVHGKLSLCRGSKAGGGLNFNPSARQRFQQLACLPFAC